MTLESTLKPTLEPQAAELIAMINDLNMPGFEEVGYEKSRIGFEERAVSSEIVEVASVVDSVIPGPDGNEIAVRIYTPEPPDQAALNQPAQDQPAPGQLAPGVVYFHGGGWVVGNINTHDGVCRMLCAFSGSTVISVDYRLAPEHRFPAAPQDCYAVTKYVSEHSDEFHVDPERLVVAGDSAGGNLAAAVALMCRDNGDNARPDNASSGNAGPKLAMQILIYPVTDFDRNTKSMNDNAEGYLLTKSTMQWFDDLYLPEADRSLAAANPYAAPLRCEDLSGLAPAVVIVAGHDPLRDEGVAYANKLAQAQVPTTLLEYPGQFHGFFSMTKFLDQAKEATHMVSALIRGVKPR